MAPTLDVLVLFRFDFALIFLLFFEKLTKVNCEILQIFMQKHEKLELISF